MPLADTNTLDTLDAQELDAQPREDGPGAEGEAPTPIFSGPVSLPLGPAAAPAPLPIGVEPHSPGRGPETERIQRMQEQNGGFSDFLYDFGMALPRAAEGLIHDTYGFIDKTLGFDLLPDWNDGRLTGHAKTGAGEMVTGLFQFIGGFYVAGGMLGKLGWFRNLERFGELSSKGGALAKLAGADGFAGVAARIGANMLKGAATDLLFIDAEANLSALAKYAGGVDNPITDFLASDPEHDSLIVRRMKNMMEGLGMGLVIDGVLEGFKGVRALRKARAAGASEEAQAAIKAETVTKVADAIDAARPKAAEVPVAGAAEAAAEKETFERTAQAMGFDLPKLRKFVIDGDTEDAAVKDMLSKVQAMSQYREAGGEARLYVNPRSMTPVERLLLMMEHGDLNMAHMSGAEGTAASARTFELLFGEALDAGRKSFENRHVELAKQATEELPQWLGLAGRDGDLFLGRMTGGLQTDAQSIHTATKRLLVAKGLMLATHGDLFKALQKAGPLATAPKEVIADLAQRMEGAGQLLRDIKTVQSQMGAALASNRIQTRGVFSEMETALRGKMGIEAGENEAANAAQSLDDFFKARGGEKRVRAVLAGQLENMKARGIGGLSGFPETLVKGSVWNIFTDFWINGLLGAAPTAIRNVAGNLTAGIITQIDRVLGAGVRSLAGIKEARTALTDSLHESLTFLELFGETLGVAGKYKQGSVIRDEMKRAWTTGESQLLDGRRLVEYAPGISAENVHRSWLGPLVEKLTGPLMSDTPNGSAPTLLRHATETGKEVETLYKTHAGEMVDAFGNVVRYPTKALQAMDQLSKALALRADVATRMRRNGVELGLSGQPLEDHIQAALNQVVQDGQLYTKRRVFEEGMQDAITKLPQDARLNPDAVAAHIDGYMRSKFNPALADAVDKGMEHAQYATFTLPADGSWTSQIAKAAIAARRYVPPLAVVMPFIQIPFNILRFSADHMLVDPFVGLGKYIFHSLRETPLAEARATSNRFFLQLTSKDQTLKSEAVGRLVFGVGAVSTLAMLAANSFDQNAGVAISGQGPADANERKALEQARDADGKPLWAPYSVFINGRPVISYQSADPMATLMGTVADLVTYSHFEDPRKPKSNGVMAAVITAAVNNFTSKNYMKGLSDMLQVLTSKEANKTEKVLQTFAGSLVPNVVNTASDTVDPLMREVRGYLDAIKSNVPWWRNTLPVARDVLGEEMKQAPKWGEDRFGRWMHLWMPYGAPRSGTQDPVWNELSSLQHPWSKPDAVTTHAGVHIDLLDKQFAGADGTLAYDRLQELVGKIKFGEGEKTLREALTERINSDEYKALPRLVGDVAVDDSRIGQISKTIGLYRKAAMFQLVNETPALLKYINEAAERKKGN